MVKELAHIQGQLVLAVSLGKEHVNKELPYKNIHTGEVEILSLGRFFGQVMQDSMLRDLQPINLLFTELLPYTITQRDKYFSENNR